MRLPFPLCPTLCALAVLGLPAAGGAQAKRDTTTVEPKGQRLEAVSISATRSATVVSGAAAVVVRPMEIRSSPAPMLEQALKEAPFVLVRQNSRGEMEISVRGSDSRQTSVLLNGVPITLGWDHRTDPSLVPITGAERLVVVRGLGSLLNGPNSLGGTIEVSHDAYSESAGGRAWAGAGIDENGATVGSFGVGRRLAEIRDGALSLSAGIAHHHRDGLSLPAGAFDSTARRGLRTGTDLRQLDGFASLRWSRVGGRSIGVLVSAFDAEKGVPPEEHISSPRLWRYPYNRRVIATASASTGLISSRLGLGSLEFGASLNDGSLKIESFSDRSYSVVSAQELGDERTTSMRALLTHSLGSAMLRASYSAADIRYEETLSPAPAADYRQKLGSAGVEVEAPVGHRTKLVGGVVLDQASTPESGGRSPRQPAFSRPGWRAGISHEISPRASWHASLSDRARFPSLRELYSGALNRFRPNPDLKPESLLGFEGGVTLNQFLPATSQSSLQVIGFRHRLDDAVVRITLANPTRFMRVNRDRIESTGVELLGGLVFGAASGRAVSLSGDLALQRIRVVDESAGDQSRHAENNPERRGRLELGFPMPAQMRAAATARFSGRQYCLNADTQREDELQGRLMSDVSVQREFALSGAGPFKRLRAVLGLDNIGDVTAYDQCGLPQPGRTLRLSMSAR